MLIWLVVSDTTCVVDNASACVVVRLPIDVVLKPETCAVDRLPTVSTSIEVDVSAFSCVVESACVCVVVSPLSCVEVR